MNKTGFSYVVIKYNNPAFAKESTLLDNKYKKSAKYAMFFRTVHKDSSESLTHIKYSSDMEELQRVANSFVSWYNYPLSIYKDIQGYIKHI